MRKKLTALLAVAGGAMVALAVATAPAHSAAPTAGQATQQVQRNATVAIRQAAQPVQADASCGGWTDTEFGYTGCFDNGSIVIGCDWSGDGVEDEAFGIAPSLTIWHAWPNSGGWKQMPNNGRADDTWNCYFNGNNQRQVEVKVGSAIWYSYYSGGWKGWYQR